MEQHLFINNEHTNKRCSRSKRCIIAAMFITIFLIIAVILIIISATIIFYIASSKKKDECGTEICKLHAEHVRNTINWSADPCEDFYEFACGGWINNYYMPPYKPIYGILDMLGENNLAILKGLPFVLLVLFVIVILIIIISII